MTVRRTRRAGVTTASHGRIIAPAKMHGMRCAAACCTLFVLWSACVIAGGPPPAVTGRVFDEATGQPVADAAIAIVGAAALATSDARGCFTIQPPAPGRWAVQVRHGGYLPAIVDIGTAAGRPRRASRGQPSCGADPSLTVALRFAPLHVDEHVVVTPGRRDDAGARQPRAVSVVDSAELRDRAPRTTPDAIADAAGVFVQKTSHGSGAPYVRGLIGNHVLLLVDGIRINNATYRYGPNQYMATIDPYLLERIEIVRGPGSVLFGSDAIGGVVNVVTQQPTLSPAGVQAGVNVDTKLVSSGMEQSGRIVTDVRGRRAAMRAGATFQSFGDLVAGGSLGTERPSAYGHVAADFAVLVQAATRHLVSFGHQFDRQDDVPRWDQVVQRGYERYSFSPQERQLSHLRWRFAAPGSRLTALSVTASHQQTREGRDISRRNGTVATREFDRVRTLGVAFDATGAVAAGWTWTLGGEWYHDRVSSRRHDTAIATGARAQRRGLYPDGATASSAAAFARSGTSRGAWHAETGVRLTSLRVSTADPLFRDVGLERVAVVADAGATWQAAPRVQVVGHVAQSFRAPNIDDLGSLGRFDFGVEVPAPDLEPERAVTFEAGVRIAGRRAAGRFTAYRTDLRDLIDRVRVTDAPSGPCADAACCAQAPSSNCDWSGQDIYRKANVGRAVVVGIEAEGEWRPTASVSIAVHAASTRGQNTTRDEPMRRIPPVNGMVRVTRRAHTWWSGGTIRWAARQDRLASGDLDDHRIPAGGTPGWATVDLSAGRRVGPRIAVRGGVSNLLNAAYRTHGSGIDGAGRAAWMAVAISTTRTRPDVP